MEAEISNFHKKMTPFLKIFYKKVKLCVAFSIFDSVFFLVKLTFLFNKKHGLYDFRTS